MRHQKMIALALYQALQSDLQYRLGSVFVSSGKVVATGHNNGVRQRFNKQNVCSTHAELNVLWKIIPGKHQKTGENYKNRHVRRRKRNRYHGKADVYVIRVLHDGSYGNARPCQECVNALRCAGVRRVFYSVEEGGLQMEWVNRMESNHLSIHQRNKSETGRERWYF